jgi:ABC-type amino acid transport substrate-binding protein
MNFNFRVLFALFVSLSLWAADGYAERFVMGVVDAPPFINFVGSEDKPDGMVISRLDKIFDFANIKVEYYPTNLTRMTRDLENGVIDGFPLNFSSTSSVSSSSHLSDVYFELPIYLWCAASKCANESDIARFFQRNDVTLGVIKNANYGEPAKTAISTFAGIKYESTSIQTLWDMLKAGKIDYFISFAQFAERIEAQNDDKQNMVVRSIEPIYVAKYKITFDSKNVSDDTKNQINTAIAALVKSESMATATIR